MIAHALLFVLLFAIAFYVPGRLAVALLPSPRREESFVFSVVLGIVMVNTVSASVHGLFVKTLTSLGFSPYLVLGTSLALSVMILGFGLLRRGWHLRLPRPARPTRTVVALWLATAVGFLFYLLYYDVDQMSENVCIAEFATQFNTPVPQGSRDPTLEGFMLLRNFRGHRWGSDVLLSPLLALFGRFAFRLVYALQGLVLPAAGYLLGRSVLRREWAAWATAALLTFSPFSLESQAFDENFMSLSFGAVALALLLRERPAFFLAGATLGLYFGIRPEAGPQLAVVLYFVWRIAREHGLSPVRMAGRLLAGLAAFGSIYVLVYALRMMESGLFYEATLPALVPHRFFGFAFDARYLLNFPFVDEPLRSPYVAYPNLWLHPLDLLRRFGLLLAALVPGGLVFLFRRHRPTAWLLVGWFLPMLVIVMVQSNWSAAHKLGIPATSLPPAILAIVGGALLLVERTTRLALRVSLPIVGVVLPLAFFFAVRDVQAPLDRRVDIAFEADKTEDEPRYVEWSRARFVPGLLPDLRFGEWHPRMLGVRAAQLREDLVRPWMREYQQPMLEFLLQYVLGQRRAEDKVYTYHRRLGGERVPPLWRGAPDDAPLRTLALDMGRSPVLDEGSLARVAAGGTGEASPLVLDGRAIHAVRGLRVPWTRESQTVLLARDLVGVVHAFVVPDSHEPLLRTPGVTVIEHDGAAFPSLVLPLAVPDGTVVRILLAPHLGVNRGYLRYAVVDGDRAPWLSRPTVIMRW